MKRKEPTHSEYPIHEPSSSLTSPHVGDYEGRTKRAKGTDYEVFLSFRGEDTRKGFTDHLYHNLDHAGIRVFRDDNELRIGEEIGPELLCNITNSKISIPIISENYASSKWCLHELAEMLKCKRSKGQIVLPIFYKVEPSQMRHPTGRWRDAINAHKKNMDEMVVKKWEEALKEVSSLKGWVSEKIDNGHEGTLVKIVVQKVMGELKGLFRLNVPEQLVGIDHHVQEIMSKIDAEFSGPTIVGIYGMGGIGKTTLAKVLYNRLCSHFDCRSFMANIRETSQRKGIECIQKQLISNIIRISYDVSNVDEGVSIIKSHFTSKKVLILLDDMDDSTHSNALVGDGSWFGAGSIVIITTRNQSILDEGRVGYMYQLNELSLDQSLILFSRHAFRMDSPPSDYEDNSHDIVSTTRGLPLALEVIGSFLCGKREEVWKDTLKKLKKVPDRKVQEKLKISYEALDDEEQQIFLDIACFFIGSHKRNPTYMWDASSFLPGRGIEVLRFMSLIKIDEYGQLMMHDQLRDLGREIVRLENSKKPQKRSRLWNSEEAVDVIDGNKGTEKIEALSLGECGKGRIYTAEQFKQMTNLRFLLADGANFTGDFQSLLPKLRWLQWAGCPSDFIAANFHPNKLVVLDLSNSAISEDWGGWVQLKMATELKVLNLRCCQSLRRTPDFTAFESLEILILRDCVNLEEIHPSVGDIKTLVSLDVSWCRRLNKLPAGIGRMVKLRELCINGTDIQAIPISRGCLMKLETLHVLNCHRLYELPELLGSLVSLTLLDLYGSSIEGLPESIGSMKELQTLKAGQCRLLAYIPSSIGDLASLQSLSLCRCSLLTKIPDSIGKLASLTELDLKYTSITKLPESIGNMPNLRILEISGTDITELPDAIGKLAKLQRLGAEECEKLERLPSNICELVSLEELCLKQSGISSLPESISKLSSLRELYVGYCEKLRELPELPSGLRVLTIACQRPSLLNLSQLSRLKELSLINCPWLERALECPIGLLGLIIEGCGKLKAFTNLSNLRHFSMTLSNYFDLTEVTNSEGSHCLSNLHGGQRPKISRVDGIEDSSKLTSPNASQLDGLLDLPNSKILQETDTAISCVNSVGYCEKLLELLEPPSGLIDLTITCQRPPLPNLSQLSCLKELTLTNCPWLERVPDLPIGLSTLIIEHCGKLKAFTNLSNLKHLFRLYLAHCFDLTEVTSIEGPHCLSNLPAGQCPKISRVDGIEDSSKLMSPKASEIDGSLDLSDPKFLHGTDAAASCANSVEIQGLGGSESSQVSDVFKCASTGRLLDFSNFKYLTSLEVWNCKNVTEIQGLDGSESLEFLSINGCSSLRSVDLSNLKNLQFLIYAECENLVEIRGLDGLVPPLRVFDTSRCPSLRQSPDLLRLKALATEWVRRRRCR